MAVGIVRFQWDYVQMGAYLRTSPDLSNACYEMAKEGAETAKGLAPVGTRDDKYHSPGRFRDSIKAERAKVLDGRQGAIITSDVLWSEFGRRRTRSYKGAEVLRRAGQSITARKRIA